MKKIFIFTVFALVLSVSACVEKRNLVVLDKFVPITTQSQCAITAGGDLYYTKGEIDLAFTDRYILPFQITNYISSSATSKVNGDVVVDTGETNYFYVKWAEVEYEWDPRPQTDGKQLQLDANLWSGVKRVEVHGVVAGPDGGQNAGAVDILTEVQSKDLLAQLTNDNRDNDYDWVASPLLIKMKIVGELTDGTEIKTNTMRFNLEPRFGDSIQMGSVFKEPAGGFADVCEAFDTIIASCAFNDPVIGCIPGQDSALVNCYAGNSEWMKYVAQSRCYSENKDDCFNPESVAGSVVEVYYNGFWKSPTDGAFYRCCPGEKPEEPEECSQDAAGGD